MKAIKHLVCLLFLALLCLFLFPLSGTASAAKYTDTIQWRYSEGGILTISGTGHVPSSSNRKVPWERYQNSISEIVIAPGITGLGAGLFRNYTKLVKVTLPDGLEEIGAECFLNCTNLTAIQFPDTLKYIERRAFKGCSGITSITIPSAMRTVYSEAFANCDTLKTVHISSLATWLSITFEDNTATPLYYGAELLLNGEPLTEITIPDGIDAVSPFAFYGCKDLRTVVLPDGVIRIGGRAFSGCRNLASISLPASLESISDCAFEGCHSLTKITYNGGIKELNRMTILQGNDVVVQHLTRIYGMRIMTVRNYVNCALGLLVAGACVFFTRKRWSF